MKIGAFSISLNVKDIKASRIFYEKLDFAVIHGVEEDKWLIMQNEDVTIGLFEGMLEKNTLTFNPGWDRQAKDEEEFTDIRELQKDWKSKGIKFISEVDESTEGPGSFIIVDPDGNPILVDQHRSR